MRVGKGRILVLHGDRDGMIPAKPHVEDLIRGLGGGRRSSEEGKGEGGGDEVQSKIWEHTGHVLPVQSTEELARLITEMVQKNK